LIVASQGQSAGVNTSSAFGSANTLSNGAITGQSAVLGVSISEVQVVGSISGTVVVSGSGVSEFPAAASAQGSSSGSAIIAVDIVVIGSITGTSTAQASSVLFTTAVAYSSGNSSAFARGSFIPKAPQQSQLANSLGNSVQSEDFPNMVALASPRAAVVKANLGNFVQRK
jgi:hypothetical protein